MKTQSYRVKDRDLSHQQKLVERQKLVAESRGEQPALFAINSFKVDVVSQKNCENLVGSVEVPVGIAGEVSLEIMAGKNCSLEKYLVPLATTEGALVASVSRGLKAINQAGGAQVFIDRVGMTRAPVFQFTSGSEARNFLTWVEKKFKLIKNACEATSQHLKLSYYQPWIRGRLVFLRFYFDTDQAMGMNMATIALKAAWKKVLKSYPDIKLVSLSGNVCTDKKESAVNRLLGRGFRAQAEVVLSEEVLKKVLKTDADHLLRTHYGKNLVGTNVANSSSSNMHAANTAAALFLATGQDMAHVVGASQAATTVEGEGAGVYAAINLPNLNLGVVGGGTDLPAFVQARAVIAPQLSSQQLAAVVAAACLAGELSGLAALSSHSLAAAHQNLGRNKKTAKK